MTCEIGHDMMSVAPLSPWGKWCQEGVKEFTFKLKYLAQRRGVAESTNKIKQLFISNFCASAPRREILHFFTCSWYRFLPKGRTTPGALRLRGGVFRRATWRGGWRRVYLATCRRPDQIGINSAAATMSGRQQKGNMSLKSYDI